MPNSSKLRLKTSDLWINRRSVKRSSNEYAPNPGRRRQIKVDGDITSEEVDLYPVDADMYPEDTDMSPVDCDMRGGAGKAMIFSC